MCGLKPRGGVVGGAGGTGGDGGAGGGGAGGESASCAEQLPAGFHWLTADLKWHSPISLICQ